MGGMGRGEEVVSEGEGGEAAEDGGGGCSRGLKALCTPSADQGVRVYHHVKA